MCFLVVVYIYAVLRAWLVTVGTGLLKTINDLAFNNHHYPSTTMGRALNEKMVQYMCYRITGSF
jgi:hypothetical protein